MVAFGCVSVILHVKCIQFYLIILGKLNLQLICLKHMVESKPNYIISYNSVEQWPNIFTRIWQTFKVNLQTLKQAVKI